MTRKMRRAILAAGLTAAAALTMAPAGAQAFTAYRVTATTAHYNGDIIGLNDEGVAVGRSTHIGTSTTDDSLSWNWSTAGAVPANNDPLVPEPPATYEWGASDSVSNTGLMTGYSFYLPDHHVVGWISDGRTTTTIPNFFATSIDTQGTIIAGDDENGVNPVSGAYYRPGVTPSPVALGSDVGGMSDDGTVLVGLAAPDPIAVYWNWPGSTSVPPTQTAIPIPAGQTNIYPQWVNDDGWIAGPAYNASPNPDGFFAYHIGDAASEVLPITGPDVVALSNHNLVSYHDFSGSNHLYNLDTGFDVLVDNLLLNPSLGSSLQTFSATDIAGGYVVKSGVTVPAVFQPVSPQIPQQPQFKPRLFQIPDDAPGVPLTFSWTAKAAAHDPITRETAQVSSDGGKTWQTEKLSKLTATSLNFTFADQGTFQVRVAATDSLNNTSAYTTTAPFTARITDDADQSVSYSGKFTHLSPKSALDGTVSETSDPGAAISYTLTGSEIGVVAQTGAGEGTAELFLDGVDEGPVSFAASKGKAREVIAGFNFTQGTHTVKLLANGDGPIEFDGFTSVSQ